MCTDTMSSVCVPMEPVDPKIEYLCLFTLDAKVLVSRRDGHVIKEAGSDPNWQVKIP
jgi:hypothetical protein